MAIEASSKTGLVESSKIFFWWSFERSPPSLLARRPLHSHLLKINFSASILVNVPDHLVNGLVLGLETQTLHGSLELLGVDGPTSVGIEEVEGLPDLLDLLLGEAGPLVGRGRLTGGGTTRLVTF